MDVNSTLETWATQVASGTSMSAPAAAGLALLIRQYFKNGYYPTGTPTSSNGFEASAALLKAMLVSRVYSTLWFREYETMPACLFHF